MLPADADPPAGLTYKLLPLRLDRSKMEYDAELGRQEMEIEREKLELKLRRLKLIQDGKLGPSGPVGPDNFNVAKNVRLLPKFEESNVEMFFNFLDYGADIYKWLSH